MDLISIKQASIWASEYLGKNVTTSNIAYLVNYGKISKVGDNGSTLVSKEELMKYYDSYFGKREIDWRDKLGDDLNWSLSFDYLKEAQTTKHVHRLHPYKGKYIPQLVEYFLDSHTDNFKQESYFQASDIILDPFCGSGTTLVQANELNINAIGIDISAFNSLISNCKVSRYDLAKLYSIVTEITNALSNFVNYEGITKFDLELSEELTKFNNYYFPVPDFKRRVQQKEIDGNIWGAEREREFLDIYDNLVAKYGIELLEVDPQNFIETWFVKPIRREIDFVFDRIKAIDDMNIKRIMTVILSRTMRSCRATTHADLATLKEPMTKTYYCAKHGKICKPLFSIFKWWQTYSNDTIKRLAEFDKIRTQTMQFCITGDSRNVNIEGVLAEKYPELKGLVSEKRIRGIFSSPPYVGLIDYHQQHAYSYDLFGFQRNDALEIGPLFRGQTKAAKESYVEGISDVLINCRRFLVEDFDIFLVSNDKYGLYPLIAERASMQIVNTYKRPVLNRTEKDKGAYSEIIFHLKRK